jgi:hypothetical protein
MRIFGNRLAQLTGVVGAIGIAVACSQPGTPLAPSSTSSTASVERTAEILSFELCKDYVGTPGPSVTFNIAVDVGGNGSIDDNIVVVLANGACQEFFPATIPVEYTVTEVVPTGYTASWVRTTFAQAGGVTTVEPSVAGNVAVGLAGGDRGQMIVFTNTELPPPPGDGGEGCTPGYWKQPHHFDSWTAPYTPTTLFSAVFDNAFPGMTLAQVAGLGGGGLNALGRHTVAALLNAASPGVDYDLTTTEVIDLFNAAFPGSNSAYETLKNQFEQLNQQGCSLN